MAASRILEALPPLTTVLVGLGAMTFGMWNRRAPFAGSFLATVVVMAVVCAVGLGSAWLACGAVRMLQRAATLVAILATGSMIFMAMPGFTKLADFLPVFLVEGLVVMTLGYGLRLADFQLASHRTVHTAESRQKLRQFSVRQLLVLTTCLAVGFGSMRWLGVNQNELIETAGFAALFGLPVIPACWAVLGRDWIRVRLATVPAAMGLALLASPWLIPRDNQVRSNVAVALGMELLLLAGVLLLARLAGLRLVRAAETNETNG